VSAGELRERLVFSSREDLSQSSPPGDEMGNLQGDWIDRFTVWGRFQPLRGGEDVMQSRLAGKQPGIIRVRYSEQTRAIRPEWRAKNARTGATYAITAAANMDEKRQYLDILAVGGGNDG